MYASLLQEELIELTIDFNIRQYQNPYDNFFISMVPNNFVKASKIDLLYTYFSKH